MIYYGLDYVAQIGTLLICILCCAFLLWVWFRLLKPMFERWGLVERVKMALYDKELQKFCQEQGIDYSKIDVDLTACYKKKGGKLKERLREIEEDM